MGLRRLLVVLAGAAFIALCIGGSAGAYEMITNEYNAVRSDNFLKDSKSDTYFGRVIGNGGDWMEFVTIEDNLDIRGWKFVMWQDGALDATIILPDWDAFSCLRSGTIFTMAESVATDLTYNPIYDPGDPNAGDWWVNYQASFSFADTTHRNFQITIFDRLNNIIYGPAGEGISPVSGVGSDEVWKLEADPSSFIPPNSNSYTDGSSSTFGSPNQWSGGMYVQDFSGLRSVVPEPASLLLLGSMAVPILLRRRRR